MPMYTIKLGGSWFTWRIRRLRRAPRRRRHQVPEEPAVGALAAADPRLDFVCTKTVTESEISKNFEIPPQLSSCIMDLPLPRTRIQIQDSNGVFDMEIGMREDRRRNFFLMRTWRSFRVTRGIIVGSQMNFYTTAAPNRFFVDHVNIQMP